MATADRILQLKLISDVSDINQKMGGVNKEVGKVQKAFGGLKSFIGPAIAGIGLQLAAGLGQAFQDQLKHAEDLRNAFVGLEETGKSMGLPEGRIRKVADTLRDIGVSLGVGEDAKIVSALRDIATITGDIKLSKGAVQAIFDTMRQFDVDFDTAKGYVINGIILGRSRYMDLLGISGDTASERLGQFNEKFGSAAEEFAKTTEGKWQKATAEWDGHMLNLAIVADDAIAELKATLVTAWNRLTGIVDGIATIWEGIDERWGDAIREGIQTIYDILEPFKERVMDYILAPIRTIRVLLGAVWKLINGDVQGAVDDIVDTVRGFANNVIDLLNQLSNAFAFSAVFELPSFDIPDPTQLLEGGTIKIGGGTVDLSRGPLFDTIPHLARGGIVRRPTFAMIGEAGPEAIVPLSRGAGASYTINVNAPASSPADVGRAVVEAIEAYERRSGNRWRA